jgi:hypothetical protein
MIGSGKSLPVQRKAFHMSYKTFSVQSTPGKQGSAETPKEAPPAGQPDTQPDQKPAEVAPAPKS